MASAKTPRVLIGEYLDASRTHNVSLQRQRTLLVRTPDLPETQDEQVHHDLVRSSPSRTRRSPRSPATRSRSVEKSLERKLHRESVSRQKRRSFSGVDLKETPRQLIEGFFREEVSTMPVVRHKRRTSQSGVSSSQPARPVSRRSGSIPAGHMTDFDIDTPRTLIRGLLQNPETTVVETPYHARANTSPVPVSPEFQSSETTYHTPSPFKSSSISSTPSDLTRSSRKHQRGRYNLSSVATEYHEEEEENVPTSPSTFVIPSPFCSTPGDEETYSQRSQAVQDRTSRQRGTYNISIPANKLANMTRQQQQLENDDEEEDADENPLIMRSPGNDSQGDRTLTERTDSSLVTKRTRRSNTPMSNRMSPRSNSNRSRDMDLDLPDVTLDVIPETQRSRLRQPPTDGAGDTSRLSNRSVQNDRSLRKLNQSRASDDLSLSHTTRRTHRSEGEEEEEEVLYGEKLAEDGAGDSSRLSSRSVQKDLSLRQLNQLRARDDLSLSHTTRSRSPRSEGEEEEEEVLYAEKLDPHRRAHEMVYTLPNATVNFSPKMSSTQTTPHNQSIPRQLRSQSATNRTLANSVQSRRSSRGKTNISAQEMVSLENINDAMEDDREGSPGELGYVTQSSRVSPDIPHASRTLKHTSSVDIEAHASPQTPPQTRRTPRASGSRSASNRTITPRRSSRRKSNKTDIAGVSNSSKSQTPFGNSSIKNFFAPTPQSASTPKPKGSTDEGRAHELSARPIMTPGPNSPIVAGGIERRMIQGEMVQTLPNNTVNFSPRLASTQFQESISSTLTSCIKEQRQIGQATEMKEDEMGEQADGWQDEPEMEVDENDAGPVTDRHIDRQASTKQPDILNVLSLKANQPVKPKTARKPRKKDSYSIPTNLVRQQFNHFAGMRVSKEAIEEVMKISETYWDNLAADLEAYAKHAGRKRIVMEDFVLLFKRQGLITDKQSLTVLIEKYLPMEERRRLIPVARAGNRIELFK